MIAFDLNGFGTLQTDEFVGRVEEDVHNDGHMSVLLWRENCIAQIVYTSE